MGYTIWIEVEGRPLPETAHDSTMIYLAMDHLDILAGKLGIQKLSGYYDYSDDEMTNDYHEMDDDDLFDRAKFAEVYSPEERQTQGVWFDSTRGLQTVGVLRQRLIERFDDLNFPLDATVQHWRGELLDELARMKTILTAAVASGKSFRLLQIP